MMMAVHSVRRGLGRGLGIGYKNLIPIDPYIHSLSAKGVKTRRSPPLIKLRKPTVEVLSEKEFNKKFEEEYTDAEVGYAITKIHPDGDVQVTVKDSGDDGRNGLLLMHELKEIEIWHELVNEKNINPHIADEMAHNMNPIKIDGVSEFYELNAET